MNELIEKYFENNLTPEEQFLFDEKLKNDADFKSELEFHSELKNAITVSERAKIKAQIKGFESSKKDNIKVFNLRKLMTYAAVFLVVISIGIFFILNQKTDSNQLYASNFEPYPNIEVSNLRSNSENSLENEAFTAYDLENYKLAHELFTELLETESKDYLHFYNAMCTMQLENFDLAINELSTVNENDSKYYEKAIWFKELIYLKLNKKKDTKILLEELVNHYSFKKEEAKQLLSKL